MPTDAPISPERGLDLWRQLRDGDAVAGSDLAVAYVDWLSAELCRANPRIDPHLSETAADDALLNLLKHPGAYDPDRLPLHRYLLMAARRDLQNLVRSESRHWRGRGDWEAVELFVESGNDGRGEDDPARIVEAEDDAAERAARIAALRPDGMSREEALAWPLMQAGVRKTEEYAATLGWSDLPIDEQRRKVKQVKDRLLKRLARAGRSSGRAR